MSVNQESNLKENTFEYGANAVYIAEIYEKYLRDPSGVSDEWREYFDNFGDNLEQVKVDFGKGNWGKSKSQVVGYFSKPYDVDRRRPNTGRRKQDKEGGVSQEVLDSIHAHMLIRAYRVRGHLIANLDPLGLAVKRSHPELDPAKYGFNEDDYDRPVQLDGWLGHDRLSLREILDILHQSYSDKFTVEYVHIQSLEKKEWIESKVENSLGKPTLSAEHKKHILSLLVETVGFEEFLHKKFPGAKRFSAEGGENLMSICHYVVEKAASLGLKEVVIGMPHRGRLNVLTCFMGKPYVAMLSEFQGNLATPDDIESSGDVKYHLGFSSDKEFGGNEVHMSLTSNPSHLETVNPVVMGKVRAKQDQLGDTNRDNAMGLLLHGDAAFCGQGVVMETLAMSELDGYTTGGTIHIVVNNQVGFTTNPSAGHKSPYPTDIAQMIQSPIFHVNGDDPEAVVHAAQLAAEYRAEFKQDVVIDMWCYRKHGHNEGDEPRWTQPKMYKVIDAKETPREIYADKLIREGVITPEEFEKMKDDFYNRLDSALERSNSYKPEKADMLEGKWEGITRPDDEMKAKIETGVDKKLLESIGKQISTTPEDITLHKGIQRVQKLRAKMIETGEGFDWAMAEALAFGSLMSEGKHVRLSGQDCIRGTFSHRHAGLWDQDCEEETIHFPLNNIKEKKADLEVLNSNLSEYGVMGFEYGYSSSEPNALVMWEGQFGDFVNGAQIIIDQYVTSSEIKWLRMSGLVLLLPHGYEGQGPEHSSARLERFLQQCAEDNMIVANCTTPANYYHILRRQMVRDFRKPLILMTPKSLLRHKLATSTIDEMAEGSTFHRVLPEIDKLKANKSVKKLLLCSGKVYYDLLEARRANEIDDVAIVRVEQLYPFPKKSLPEEIKKYPNAEVIWVQEEPQNMGAWTYIDRRLEEVLIDVKAKNSRPIYVGRDAAAATACGYMKVHKYQQEKLVNEALGIKAKASKKGSKK